MTPEQRDAGLRALGHALEGRDLECYATFAKDPCAPILGAGDPSARICCFGRDPGRDEVRHGEPFVGAGGQKLRAALHRVLFGADPPDFDASLRAGRHVYWANMVPFKPLGNKAWPPRVLRAFRPYVADLLVHDWRGTDVICLGEGAFRWFGLDDRDDAARLAAHWARDDRFETSIAVTLRAPDGAARGLTLHPLPHPSPLNATWTPHFPRLADARLRSLGLGPDSWRVEDA